MAHYRERDEETTCNYSTFNVRLLDRKDSLVACGGYDITWMMRTADELRG